MKTIQTFLSLILILLALSSCSGKRASPALAGNPDHPGPNSISETLPGTAEYIPFESLRLNGKLPMISSPKAVFDLMGQPDSIVPVDLDDACGYYLNLDSNVKLAYVKGGRFEVRGDSAVLTSVLFKDLPGLFLKTPQIILSGKTTLEDIARLFPKAYSTRGEMNVSVLGKGIGIRIDTTATPMENACILFFQNGKLMSADYFIPC